RWQAFGSLRERPFWFQDCASTAKNTYRKLWFDLFSWVDDLSHPGFFYLPEVAAHIEDGPVVDLEDPLPALPDPLLLFRIFSLVLPGQDLKPVGHTQFLQVLPVSRVVFRVLRQID